MNTAAQELTIRGGFEFVCEATAWTPAILKIQPRLDPWQRKEKEQMASFPYHLGGDGHEFALELLIRVNTAVASGFFQVPLTGLIFSSHWES